MKKGLLFKFFSLVIAVLLLGACSMDEGKEKNSGNEGGKDSEKKKIGLSISTLNNPFFVTLKEGAEAKAKELGVDLTTVDAQDDPAKQVSDIEDLIQQGVDLVLVNPADSSAVVSAIEAANDAGIPVITIDRSAEGGEMAAHIASDNVAGGKMAGELIIEQLAGKGKVVELEGISGSSAARERGQGFNDAIKEASGIEVVARQTANFDRAQGLSVMENIIQSTKDFQAVFAHNDEMALGALEAIEAAGLKDVIVVGFDATDDAVKAVEEGKLFATIAQKPKKMGEIGVETAVKVLNGEKVDTFIPVELELIRKE